MLVPTCFFTKCVGTNICWYQLVLMPKCVGTNIIYKLKAFASCNTSITELLVERHHYGSTYAGSLPDQIQPGANIHYMAGK